MDHMTDGRENQDIVLAVVIQQMSLMLKDLDANRIFTSETHRQEIEKVFRECLEELYANAQPEEVYEWISDLPADLGEEINDFDTQFGDETKMMGSDMDKMRDDPELQAFMKAFDNPDAFLESSTNTQSATTSITSPRSAK